MLFTEQFPQHRAGEIARAVQRGARFIEAMTLGSIGSLKLKNKDEYDWTCWHLDNVNVNL